MGILNIRFECIEEKGLISCSLAITLESVVENKLRAAFGAPSQGRIRVVTSLAVVLAVVAFKENALQSMKLRNWVGLGHEGRSGDEKMLKDNFEDFREGESGLKRRASP